MSEFSFSERTAPVRIVLGVAVLSVAVAACGGSGSPATAPPAAGISVTAYNGPGSDWDTELGDDDTFMFSRRPEVNGVTDLVVEGTYERTDEGFLLLTVASADGVDAPEAGDTAWAVEASGYALMLVTEGSSFIPMIESGSCPSANLNGNWVIASKHDQADATDTDGDYFGVFAFDSATGAGSLPARYSLADGFPALASTDLETGTCADGIMQVDDAVMYLTQSGGSIVHTNISDPDEASIIFALPVKTASAIGAFDGSYAGLVFDPQLNGDQILPVIVDCASGICTGGFVSNIAQGTVADSFSVDLFGTLNAPEAGFLTGEVASDGDTGNLVCMADEDVLAQGGRMLSCVGQSPGDNTQMFNMFLVSAD